MNKNLSPDFADLRRLAEQRWNARKETKTDQTTINQNLPYLIKELEIAEIELEIQKEELTQAFAEKNTLLGHLSESREFLEEIINAIAVPVFYKNAQGVYLGCNNAFIKFVGFPREKIIGKTPFDIAPADLAQRYHEADLALMKEGTNQIYETEVVGADGNRRQVMFHKAVFRGPDGTTKGIVGAMLDITERKHAEDALRASEEKYRFVVQNSNDIIWTFDLSAMTFTFYSNAASHILGYPVETPQGYTLDDVFSKRTKKDVIVAFGKAMAKDASSNRVLMEAQHIHQNGSLVWLEINAVLQKNSLGQPVSFSGVSRDITDRKRAEEERMRLELQLNESQKMESVGRLAGGVAHDFNNMLGVIIGHAEMALDQADSNQVIHEDLFEILKAAQRSADLTRQLLAFARRQTASPVVLDLNDTISGMLKMLRRLIGEDIDLVWKPGIDLWTIKIDPTQIDQILVNLLVNAKDAISGVGNVTIETDNVVFDETYCETHAGLIPGRFVMMAVSDSGAGMNKGTIEHIFEPFYTTKEVGKGTGLGLATVYGIVKQNNGVINVYSEPGQGTSFKIYLPEAVETIETVKEDTPHKNLNGSETVLLVEDEEAILKLGKSILQRYGYTVLSAITPHEALPLAQNHQGKIQLLITDVIMPEMNGKELKEILVHLHPEIKCLYMSGYTANAIAHHGVLDEGVNFLQKPFSVKTLGEKVREVLDGK